MWIPKILVDVILKQVSSLLLVLVHVLIPMARVVILVLIPVQASDLPNELVQVFADQANSWNNRPPPPGQQARGGGAKSTEGEECYIYLMGRLYALLSDTFAYTKVTSPPPARTLMPLNSPTHSTAASTHTHTLLYLRL